MDELTARISEKAQEAGQGSGITNRKEQLRAALVSKVSALSGILQALANEQENGDLLDAVKVNKLDLTRLRKHNVDALVKKIVAQAKVHIDDLADFGSTPESLTEILSTLEDFNGLIGKPRAIMNQRYVALGILEELFTETKGFLNDKLDKVMLIFREGNPEF